MPAANFVTPGVMAAGYYYLIRTSSQ